MQVIEVLISPKGETSVETKGFAGADCLKASEWLEQALGIATEDRKTAEYYTTTAHEQHVQQQ